VTRKLFAGNLGHQFSGIQLNALGAKDHWNTGRRYMFQPTCNIANGRRGSYDENTIGIANGVREFGRCAEPNRQLDITKIPRVAAIYIDVVNDGLPSPPEHHAAASMHRRQCESGTPTSCT
jgi:hypothetical protein